ncbi:MAG: TolC family protein, partial [Acidobacteriota bacterium]
VRPGDGPRPQDELAALPPLAPPPLGLPIELLDRRPDVRAAEWRLRAATSRIGVELADLYPSLTLTGSAGVTSESASDLLSVDEIVYNLFAGLSGPLFDRGRRQAEVLETRADAEGAAAEYASAVLGAAREVEDALVREDGLRAQLAHATTRVEEARAADRIARSRYLRGVETLIRVLETERRLRAAEDSLVALEEALWQARIDLHLAVGGDWSVPSPPALDVLESENFPTLAAPAMATEPPVEASADPSRTANAEDA